MARIRYRLSPPSTEPPIEDRILQSLYPQAPGLMPAPEPAAIENDVYGNTAPERNAILLSRLIRAEAHPQQRSKFGIVE